MERGKIHVFRFVDRWGDGLVFVYDGTEKGKMALIKYKQDKCWKYLGTLSEFIKYVKEKLKEMAKNDEEPVLDFWWEG